MTESTSKVSPIGIKKLNCPTCQKIISWTDEFPQRPFCSKKCQLIDFGEWASESFSIPVEEGPEDFRLDDLEINEDDLIGKDSKDFLL